MAVRAGRFIPTFFVPIRVPTLVPTMMLQAHVPCTGWEGRQGKRRDEDAREVRLARAGHRAGKAEPFLFGKVEAQ
jgi:hypothetical protein